MFSFFKYRKDSILQFRKQELVDTKGIIHFSFSTFSGSLGLWIMTFNVLLKSMQCAENIK